MTTLVLALAAAIFGLVLGSFATVLIYRVPRHESVLRPRSKCPGCGREITNLDNIPVFSWVRLHGKCRHCGEPISKRYPLTELASAGLFILAMLGLDPDLYAGLVFGVFFVILLALSMIDLEHGILPNAIIYPCVPAFAAAIVLGWAIGSGLNPLWGIVGGLGFGGFLLVVVLVYPKGMGMGDVKLAVLIGLVVGSLGIDRLVVGIVASFFLGGIIGILVLGVRAGKASHRMPFGPFLALGAVVGTFAGPAVAHWYLGLLGP